MVSKEQIKVYEKVDKAIMESVHETPDSANIIAKKTGEHVSLVARRFLYLGFSWTGKRWSYKHHER